MTWIKQHKEILMQIVLFAGIGILFHKNWMLYFDIFLILLLFNNKLSKLYITTLNKIINYIGVLLKTILFTLLFVFIIIPIGLIIKFTTKGKTIDFVTTAKQFEPASFLKMW